MLIQGCRKQYRCEQASNLIVMRGLQQSRSYQLIALDYFLHSAAVPGWLAHLGCTIHVTGITTMHVVPSEE